VKIALDVPQGVLDRLLGALERLAMALETQNRRPGTFYSPVTDAPPGEGGYVHYWDDTATRALEDRQEEFRARTGIILAEDQDPLTLKGGINDGQA